MIEIRIHGRGGQGSVTASEVLAVAAFKDGKYSQAFPKFGPERTGAPVEAFCRIDDKFVKIRSQIYEPDYLVVLDQTLLDAVDVTSGLKPGSIIVINASDNDVKEKLKDFDVRIIDATKIAMKELGRPIVNTAIVGAFLAATNVVSLNSLEEALSERFEGNMREKNINAVKQAYSEMKKNDKPKESS
ncbi:pyruvate ferredoxin oxidoreductase [archaeon]|nr:pyruvate ferredoxin oxidoreductase [archaeon]|tara:strand:- start:1222 stop:1782 length:561 start_codon:yes stop_codon:yes gene_type:complete